MCVPWHGMNSQPTGFLLLTGLGHSLQYEGGRPLFWSQLNVLLREISVGRPSSGVLNRPSH